MAEYIDKAAAITIADYAADEHPYKEPGKPETYSGYNEGWNDACDYIRDRLDELGAADAVPIVRCCECKYHDHDGATGYCRWWDRWSNMDEYCTHGEVADK